MKRADPREIAKPYVWYEWPMLPEKYCFREPEPMSTKWGELLINVDVPATGPIGCNRKETERRRKANRAARKARNR